MAEVNVRLLDTFRSHKNTRYSLADYAQQVGSFLYNGHYYSPPYQQTLTGAAERMDNSFESLVRSAYQANGVVFACMLARRALFSEGRFQWRQVRSGRLGDYFGTAALEVLEKPWPGGVTGDLLAKMIDDAGIAGNSYTFREDGTAPEVVRLRPDYVDIVLAPRRVRGERLGWTKVGYAYYETGDRTAKPVPMQLHEVAHFAPDPDPMLSYLGMSWLTPVLREIAGDKAATAHKLKFFEQGATPNMIVKVSDSMSIEDFKEFMEIFDADATGLESAYRTLFLGGGADVEVVGKDFQQLDFKTVQGAGETRIAAAAGVPPVIVGLSEGLQGSSLNTGNYMAARRNFADRTLRPLWRNAAASISTILPELPGAELAIDPRDIAFLSEDKQVESQIQQTRAITIRQYLDAGCDFDSVIKAVTNNDESLLKHSGLFSVQLQPPDTTPLALPPGGSDDNAA
jgi:phage portal protein BeeE